MQFEHPQTAYAKTLDTYVKPGIRWLDIGCGRQIVPDWAAPLDAQKRLVERASFLVGADVDAAIREHPLIKERVMAFGNRLPFGNRSFDLVTANMVMEHVDDPVAFLLEVKRVLAPSGRFLFHTPNYRFWQIFLASLLPDRIKKPLVSFIEKRNESDIFSTYYRANTVPALERLSRQTGLTIERLDLNGPYPMLIRFRRLRAIETPLIRLLKLHALRNWRSNLVVSLGVGGAGGNRNRE